MHDYCAELRSYAYTYCAIGKLPTYVGESTQRTARNTEHLDAEQALLLQYHRQCRAADYVAK